MLKKHNKLIMLLVLVTFMFTMVGSAGAATFSDVTGTSDESAAIYKLNGLGIIDGYPDGTFGPEKTITRAEFAKIACVTAGLKSVASGMGGTASPFSDVATDHWANGWINVAAAQGYVKGDPAGTFRPEDQITQAEVVTVLMRLLGYNDNLAGEWPSDYIAKAANLGVLDDVTFVANQAATRGIVAIIASATLDENVVEYAASDNLFNEAVKTYDKGDGKGKISQSYTLLYDKFSESQKTEDALIMSFSVNDDDEYTIYYYLYDDDGALKDADTVVAGYQPYSKKLADNCTLPGGSILGAIENFADFVTDDDNEIISIVLKDYKKFGPKTSAGTPMNEVVIDNGKVKIDGVKYSFADTPIVTESCNTEFAAGTLVAPLTTLVGAVRAGASTAAQWQAVEDKMLVNTISASDIADDTYDASDAYAVIMNDDDEVVALRAWTFPTPGIVEKVNGEKVTYQTGATPAAAANPLVTIVKAKLAALTGAAAVVDLDVVPDGIADEIDALVGAAPVPTLNLQSNAGAWDGFVNTTSFTDEDIYVQRDGKPAKLADLQENDTLSVLENYRGCDYYLVATSTKINGTLASAKYDGGNVKSVTVMGMTWKAPWSNLLKTTYQGRYTDDANDPSYAKLTQSILYNEYDAWNTDVSLLLSTTGKVAGLILGDTESSKMYGVVTDWSTDMTAANGDTIQNVTIMKADGEEYSYGLAEDSYLQNEKTGTRTKVEDLPAGAVAGAASGNRAADYAAAQLYLVPGTAAGAFTNGVLVSVSLDSDNIIKTIKYWGGYGATLVKTTNMDTDEDLFKAADGVWYDAKDVVVFNLVGTDLADTEVLGWKELKEAAGANYYSYYTNSSNELEYVVIPTIAGAALSTDTKYAIYYEQYSDSDDWIKFVGMDALEVDAIVPGLTKGDVVSYKLSGGKATNVTAVLDYEDTTGAQTIDTLNTGTLVLADGTSYKIDSEDTVYLDNSDDKSLKVLEGVAEGDIVIVIDDTGVLSGSGGAYSDTAMAIIVVD